MMEYPTYIDIILWINGSQLRFTNKNIELRPFIISQTTAHLGLFLLLMAFIPSVMGKINIVTIILS